MSTNKKSAIKSPSIFPNIIEDSDRFSLVVVDDLLSGISEWRNIQDIVRLTFNALADVVRNQGECIKSLERHQYEKVNRGDINQIIQQKLSLQVDYSRIIQELQSQLELKPNFDQVSFMLQDYSLKKDLDYIHNTRITHDDVRKMLEFKANERDTKLELASLGGKLEELENYINTHTSSRREFIQIQEILQTKASQQEVLEQLEQKASKQTVSNALHKKANKTDVEIMVSKKAELQDFNNLLACLDRKVDQGNYEKMIVNIDGKMNLIQNQLQSKCEQEEFDVLMHKNREIRQDLDFRIQEELKRFESYREELNNTKNQLIQLINKKSDQRELEKVQQDLRGKCDLLLQNQSIQNLRNEILDLNSGLKNWINGERKQQEEFLQERWNKQEGLIDYLREDCLKNSEKFRNFSEEKKRENDLLVQQINIQINQIKQDINREISNFNQDVSLKVQDIQYQIEKKASKMDLEELKGVFEVKLDEKVDLLEVQSALNTQQQDIGNRFIEFREEVLQNLRKLEMEISSQISQKLDVEEFSQSAINRDEFQHVQSQIQQKANQIDLQDLSGDLERCLKDLSQKADQRMVDNMEYTLCNQIEEIQKELILRANIKDVCLLLDQKSATEDVNKALSEIHRDLIKKSTKEELSNLATDQAIINETLCTENILGRWAWRSGELKQGSLVPWEIQISNTLPDNFLWEKEKTGILVITPGLYEIYCGFYSKKKPNIQILLNGEQIISAVNSNSYVLHHSSGKLKDIKHNSGNVTGLTFIDFLNLPARSRIAVVFAGEPNSEGFIGLKRL